MRRRRAGGGQELGRKGEVWEEAMEEVERRGLKVGGRGGRAGKKGVRKGGKDYDFGNGWSKTINSVPEALHSPDP
eukprot:767876-Hanusia_phi.AAC.16